MPLQAAPFSTEGSENEDDSSENPPPQETPPVDEGEDRIGGSYPRDYETVERETGKNGTLEVVELSDETEAPQTETIERDPSETTTTNGDIESNEGTDETSTDFWFDEATESVIRERHNGVPYILVLDASGRYVGWLPYTSTIEECKSYMRSSYGNGFTFIYIDSDGNPTKELFIVDDNVAFTSHYSDEVRRIIRDEDEKRENEIQEDDDTQSDSDSDSEDEFDWDDYTEWLTGTEEGRGIAGLGSDSNDSGSDDDDDDDDDDDWHDDLDPAFDDNDDWSNLDFT